MTSDRLTAETAKVGMRVVCVEGCGDSLPAGWTGVIAAFDGEYIQRDCDEEGGGWCVDRFIPADPEPALPAMTPELVAALRAQYEWAGPNEPGRKWRTPLKELWDAIEACPGLLSPAPPATTQREATISGEWWT